MAMNTQRMKLDYNHLLENIEYVFQKSKSKVVKDNAFGIEVGLNLLSSYLKQIAERAIELNDEHLIDLLIDMHILKKDGAENG